MQIKDVINECGCNIIIEIFKCEILDYIKLIFVICTDPIKNKIHHQMKKTRWIVQ